MADQPDPQKAALLTAIAQAGDQGRQAAQDAYMQNAQNQKQAVSAALGQALPGGPAAVAGGGPGGGEFGQQLAQMAGAPQAATFQGDVYTGRANEAFGNTIKSNVPSYQDVLQLAAQENAQTRANRLKEAAAANPAKELVEVKLPDGRTIRVTPESALSYYGAGERQQTSLDAAQQRRTDQEALYQQHHQGWAKANSTLQATGMGPGTATYQAIVEATGGWDANPNTGAPGASVAHTAQEAIQRILQAQSAGTLKTAHGTPLNVGYLIDRINEIYGQ